MKKLKVVVIGGGSSYTPELVEGIILHWSTLPVTEIVLVDVPMGAEKVEINTTLVKRMLKKAALPIDVLYTFNRREALIDADFVLTQLRVGGLEARAKDEHIPLKYNVIGQETTGPGGFSKALRTIPVVLAICKDMEELCPQAWLINFTNPSGIITEAINRLSPIKSLGLCNVSINMHYDAAQRLRVDHKELFCQFMGLNHLSVMTSAFYQGIDRLPDILKIKDQGSVVSNIHKFDGLDLMAERMGCMLSPYMQYFYFEKKMIEEELSNISTGIGTRAQQVQLVEKGLFECYKDETLDVKPEALSKRGGARYSEAAIDLINSIYNDLNDIQVVNVINNGAIPELPLDAAVEVNCIVNKKGAIPIPCGSLPESIRGLAQQVKAYERLTIEAAITGNRNTALLALINNPFVHDVRDAENILNELLEAHKDYLPIFWG